MKNIWKAVLISFEENIDSPPATKQYTYYYKTEMYYNKRHAKNVLFI